MIGLTIIGVVPIEIILKNYRNMASQMALQATNNVSLGKFLRTMSNFQEFIKYLNQELCMESLLFLVETTQWKEHFNVLLFEDNLNETEHETKLDGFISSLRTSLKKVYSNSVVEQANNDDDVPLTENQMNIELPHDLPFSQIVYSNSHSHEHYVEQCKESAYLLYKKYIKEGGRFEINISFEMRNRISR
eukprot:406066_1